VSDLVPTIKQIPECEPTTTSASLLSTPPEQTHSQPSSTLSKRIIELDGLRAFAILPVLMIHNAPHEGPLAFFRPIFETGWIGVDLFFVLSGYLITGILLDTVRKPHCYRNFIVRRALRILPLYYLCLALFTLEPYLLRDHSQWQALLHWGGPGWFALYVGNIRMATQAALPPVGSFIPLWSLQVEEQFYLLYPLLVASCCLRRLRNLLIACVVAAPLLRGLGMLLFPTNSVLCYVLMPCRMDALGMGGLIAVLMRDRGLPVSHSTLKRCLMAGASVCLGMFIFISHSEFHAFNRFIGYSILDLTCAALLAVVIVCPPPLMTRVLRWSPLTYTGTIAYGLYLLHGSAAQLLRKALSVVWTVHPHTTANIPIAFIASFIAAGLSWRYFESTVLALKDRYTR
jgi:peptidoglycan/LPS O-acetylase OafA/YrhL